MPTINLTKLLPRTLSGEECDRLLNVARRNTQQEFPGEPLTGAWYWLPIKQDLKVIWSIETFFDVWQPSSDHIYIWRYVLRLLEYRWQRTLRGIDYCSLPRGRVSRMLVRQDGPVHAVYHGDDSPVGKRGLMKVKQCFQLPRDCREIFDEHERCIAGQPEALSEALGYDLHVRGVAASDLDWSDE